MRKNIQNLVPKPHAYLHSMQNTSAKFHNNWWKTVRGVVPTSYPVSIHFDSTSCKKKQETKFTKQKYRSNFGEVDVAPAKNLKVTKWKK